MPSRPSVFDRSGDDSQAAPSDTPGQGLPRRLTLPEAPDTEAAKASYDNSVLTLHIAPAAHTRARKIALSSGAPKQHGLAAVRDLSGEILRGRQERARGLLRKGEICGFTGASTPKGFSSPAFRVRN